MDHTHGQWASYCLRNRLDESVCVYVLSLLEAAREEGRRAALADKEEAVEEISWPEGASND